MPALLLKLRPWLEPVVGALFFALWTVAEAGRSHEASAFVALAAISVAIAVSRWQPAIALGLVAAVVLLQVLQVVQAPDATTWPAALGVLVVVFVVALEAPKRLALVALGLGPPLAVAAGYLVGLGLNGWVGAGGGRNQADVWLVVSAVALGLYAGAWAIGFALRASLRELRALFLLRATSAQLGDVEVELTITRERDSIARDVHDVLAHSLAVVIAQADGARFAGETRPQVTDDALQAIANAARSALVDVRTLVEGLREEPGGQPQPGLADIEPLLAQLSGAGMRVDPQNFGDTKAMTPAQQLATYRIVQESLTNALRHAGQHSRTRLSFDWRGPGLALTIASTGDGRPAVPGKTAGHGIRGMKDRARLAGGWLTAGEADGEFVVTAYIPTSAATATRVGSQLELAE